MLCEARPVSGRSFYSLQTVVHCTQCCSFGFLVVFKMFPSETVADSWNNSLTQLIAFVGMSAPVFEALAREFGDFNDRITNLAGSPRRCSGRA